MKKPRNIDDESSLRIGPLAQYMGTSKTTIYLDVKAGYTFEFLRHKMTTPGHYKAWLRKETARLLSEPQTAPGPEDSERLQRELHRLHSGAGKSHARQSSHDSQSASPGHGKSGRSAQPV